MTKGFPRTFLWFCLCCTAVPSSWAALTYEGSVPIAQYIMPEAARQFEIKTKVKFKSLAAHGTDTAFSAIQSRNADIGGIARNLNDMEKAANLYSAVIGFDTIAVFLNENNPVGELTQEQIKGIFTGKIKNWKEVGGSNASIHVLHDATPGRTIGQEFKRTALGGLEYIGDACVAQENLSMVGRDIHAVTFDSLPFQISKTKAVAINGVAPISRNVRMGTYPLSRPLHLVSKEFPKGEIKKFFDFMLSGEGQAIVAQAGFVTIQ